MNFNRTRSGIDTLECTEQKDGQWECKIGDIKQDEYIDVYTVDSWEVYDGHEQLFIGDELEKDEVTITMNDNECGIKDNKLICDSELR